MKEFFKTVFIFVFCGASLFAQDVFYGEDTGDDAEESAAPKVRIGGGGTAWLVKTHDFWKKHFAFEMIEAGSWAGGGNIANRAEFRLYMPLTFSFRTMIRDIRPEFFKNEDVLKQKKDPHTDYSLAAYYKKTDSRIIYGDINFWGLTTRVNNVAAHSLPWFETHKTSGADLKTTPAYSTANDFYFDLRSPRLSFGIKPEFFQSQASFSFTRLEDTRHVFQGGADFYIKTNYKISFEGAGSNRIIAERQPKSWFDTKPYTPARDTAFYAFNAGFSSRYVCLSSDFAKSSTAFYGDGVYFNMALRLKVKRISIAAALDGSDARYLGIDGTEGKALFRSGGKFEYLGARNSRIFASTVLSAADTKSPFDCSTSKLHYDFPFIRGYLITPSRINFEFERKAQAGEKVSDLYSVLAGVNIGPFRAQSRITYCEAAEIVAGDAIVPYPAHSSRHAREYTKGSGELIIPVSIITLKGGVSCIDKPFEDLLWGFYVSASLSGKFGRFYVKIAHSQDAAENFSYSFSWRLNFKV